MQRPSASTTRLADLEVDAERFDPLDAAARYRAHGCLVVRGLMRAHVAAIAADIERMVEESWAHLDRGRDAVEGRWLDNGTLFIPAPAGSGRDRQIMLVGMGYHHSAAFLHSALEPRALDLAQAVLGPDVELMDWGQVVRKEPAGGHAKHLHQDSAYFQHAAEGPLACLIYVIDTDLARGCTHVVPGSHRLGYLPHEDTESHLGLPGDAWPFSRALPVEGRAGDALFFHQHCVHGAPANTSDVARPVAIHRYRAVGDRIVTHGTTAANRAHDGAEAASERERGVRRLVVRGYRGGFRD